MGRHLGIDFGTILVDFGRQVGFENRAKIDPKRHRKSDEKKKVTRGGLRRVFGDFYAEIGFMHRWAGGVTVARAGGL